MKERFFILLFIVISHFSFSQITVLTLEDAIGIALKNNFDIRLAVNNKEIQQENNTAGNAGMLPQADASGSYSKSSNSLKQIYSNGIEVERDASASTNLSAEVGAEWTVFDGLKMFRTKDRLSELSLQADDQLKIQIENSLQELISAYYSMVRHRQLLKAMKEELTLTAERVKISERKMQNGSGSRLEWLQARTEENRQRSLEIELESGNMEAMIKLNRLMGQNIETTFQTTDTVIINYSPALAELKKSVIDNNNVLHYYRRNQRISELLLKETNALRLPEIKLNTHYVYSKSTNEAGFSLLNRLQGFNYGVTATLPLFHGFNINRQVKIARLEVRSAGILLDAYTTGINEELYNAFREFSNHLEILQIEEQNILFAREVLNIALERYKVGASNALEQQESIRIFEAAMTRLADARYNAKISETVLKRLNGDLVK